MDLKTPLCDILGCKYPIMLASMGGIAGPELVAAVTLAGGFGVFGSALDVKNKDSGEVLEQIKLISKLCKGKPFGVGMLVVGIPATLVLTKTKDILVDGFSGGEMKELIDAFADVGAKAFIAGKGVPSKRVIDQFHARQMLVGSSARKVSHATKGVELGVDFVIVQGCEVCLKAILTICDLTNAFQKGGGHTGEVYTSVLLPQVVDAIKGRVPVVAAGGYYDGRGLASALCYGAQAIWVGTRFMLTPEAHIHRLYKEKLLRASADDTTVTKCFTGARLRVLRNDYMQKYEDHPEILEKNSAEVKRRAWSDGVWLLHSGNADNFDYSRLACVVGQSIWAIKTLKPAGDIVREMVEVASATLVEVAAKFTNDEGYVETPLCKMLGIKTCIMSAGMGGIAGKEMTSAVSKAGGFGTFGSALDVANLGPEELLAQIKEIQKMCDGTPFGVDILVHGSDGGVMIQLIDAFAKGGAKAFVSGKGNPSKKAVDAFHERGMVVASICGKLSHAQSAVKAGVDFIIVQGAEGGGHTGQVALSVLLPLVVDAVGGKIPVVAAGGVYDGRGLASALCYGATGVWVGTRFMMSPEAKTSDEYKSKLLQASSDDTCVTKAYTGATMRVLRNPYVTKYEVNPGLLEANSALVARRAWNDGVWKIHSGDAKNFDESNQAVVTGQNIGAIDSLKPCADIVRDMNKEAWTILRDLAGKVRLVRAKI